jgi:hypothetical protein
MNRKELMYECRKLTTKVLKNKAKERDGFKCVKCGSIENLEIHHKRYRIPPQLNDLITICQGHHYIINSKEESICPVCLSAFSYRTKKESICRKCGNREKINGDKK